MPVDEAEARHHPVGGGACSGGVNDSFLYCCQYRGMSEEERHVGQVLVDPEGLEGRREPVAAFVEVALRDGSQRELPVLLTHQ